MWDFDIGKAMGDMVKTAPFIVFRVLVYFGLVSAVLYWAREYLLYIVKAGHIAVLVELLDGGTLPSGRGQIDHAQAVVRERFVETSVLFGIDQLLKGILRLVNRMLFTVTAWLPIPGLRTLVAIATKVINLSLTYTDELILAYNIRVRSSNPWETSKDAVILYAQNYGTMLKNALFLLPDPSWDDKLTRASAQFCSLKHEASTFVTGPTAAAAP